MVKIRIKPITAESPVQSSPILLSPAINGEKRQTKINIKRSHNSSKVILRRSYVAGYGYDSEASDREDDPTIESHMILRFKSGTEADYVRSQIEQKNPLDGISIKFKDPRNAAVTIQGKLFAAKLVDLPTITEVHKSFDKKNIFKVADICQMLIVGDRISHEDTVLALPSHAKDFVYPNGLTPPLKNVRTRRFRKRASAKTIESVEKEVDRLFSLDALSEQTTYTIMDRDDLEKEDTRMEEAENSEYEDLAADLEAQLNSPFGSPQAKPTPTTQQQQPAAASESSDGSDIGSDDADEDNDAQNRITTQKAHREGVTQLEAAIAARKADLERAINPIMKQRLITTIRKLESQLSMTLENQEA